MVNSPRQSESQEKTNPKKAPLSPKKIIRLVIIVAITILVIYGIIKIVEASFTQNSVKGASENNVAAEVAPATPVVPTLDIAAYNAKMLQLANYPAPKVATPVIATPVTASGATGTLVSHPAPVKPVTPTKPKLWPVNTVYPNVGAILPFNRIVAYYGNFYSKGMGILGQYPTDQVIAKLKQSVLDWETADPTTPVVPAIDYIAVSAQGYAGSDGKYRARMPFSQIDHALDMTKQVNGIMILEIQPGLSNLQTEIPLLDQYLKLPNVELALDPEFAMKNGKKPGTVIGSMDASDINFAAKHLADLVTQNNLPPKVLVVHRFTEDMITRYQQITPLPQVQIIMDMDGWGTPDHKITTYRNEISKEPVQFTGFKLFYHNDTRLPHSRMMTLAEILKQQPMPSYIQYQ